jgi:hypothetical protein
MAEDRKVTELDKLRYSVYSTIVFYILADPFVMNLLKKVFGNFIVRVDGSPSVWYLIGRALVFLAIIYGMMHINDL